MKVVKVSKILRDLKRDGWYLDRQKGDHRQFKHPTKRVRQQSKEKKVLTFPGGCSTASRNSQGWSFNLQPSRLQT